MNGEPRNDATRKARKTNCAGDVMKCKRMSQTAVGEYKKEMKIFI